MALEESISKALALSATLSGRQGKEREPQAKVGDAWGKAVLSARGKAVLSAHLPHGGTCCT